VTTRPERCCGILHPGAHEDLPESVRVQLAKQERATRLLPLGGELWRGIWRSVGRAFDGSISAGVARDEVLALFDRLGVKLPDSEP